MREWRRRAKDGEWRRRAKDRGVEKEREGCGSGEGERRMGEGRRRANDGGAETTVKRAEEEGNINRRPVSVLDSPGLQG